MSHSMRTTPLAHSWTKTDATPLVDDEETMPRYSCTMVRRYGDMIIDNKIFTLDNEDLSKEKKITLTNFKISVSED